MMRALVFWLVLVVVGVGVFYALVGSDAAASTWALRVGGSLMMASAAAILYGSRGTGQRKTQVSAITFLTYGASQFIPAVEVRAILMIPILLVWFAAMAGVPASFFRNGAPSAK